MALRDSDNDLLLYQARTLAAAVENDQADLFKDKKMLQRLQDIAKFPEQDKNCILYTIDAMINNVKLKGLNA